MTKNLIILVLMVTGLSLNAQNYSKGDFLLNADVQVTKIYPGIDISPDIWEGTPFHLSVNYVAVQTKAVAISTGLHTTYFRHQTGFNENYGTFGLAVPFNVHLSLIDKLDTYIGYRMGYHFDGFQPESKTVEGHYEGLYSELYLGIRYFFIPRFGVYTEVTSTEFQLNAGVSFKF